MIARRGEPMILGESSDGHKGAPGKSVSIGVGKRGPQKKTPTRSAAKRNGSASSDDARYGREC